MVDAAGVPVSARRLPPDLAARPFTVAEARLAGVSRSRLGRVPAPWHGARSPRPATDLVGRCLDLLPVLPAGSVFSHGTAWQLWDADSPRGLHQPDALHVLVPGPLMPPRRAGVAGHRTGAPPTAVVLYRLPVVTAETAWTQLAAWLDVPELVVAGDALLRRQHPISTLARLQQTVDDLAPGTRGSRRLREGLSLLRPGTDSCMESRLRLLLRAAGLPEPEVNQCVPDGLGNPVARPDLSYPEARLAIEYDGDVHRTDRTTWRRDITRRRDLETLGWRVITCTADDLRLPRSALYAIHAALTESARMHAS